MLLLKMIKMIEKLVSIYSGEWILGFLFVKIIIKDIINAY